MKNILFITLITIFVSAIPVYAVPPDMVLIPGGTFQMGNSNYEGYSDELPLHAVTLDSFYIGKYEVTNGQCCAFLNSAAVKVVNGIVYASSDSSNSYPYCDTSISSSSSQIAYSSGFFSVRIKSGRNMSNDPMVRISWYGAVAYCNWRSQQEGKEQCYNLSTWNCDFAKQGYRLATEAEWEYATRGGQYPPYYRFPWGDTITHSQANYYSSSSFSYDISPTRGFHPTWNDGIYPYTSPVGSFAANGYGLYDIAGNVYEWCNDWFSSTYYSSSPTNNPTGPTSGSSRVLRGGYWGTGADDSRVANRSWDLPLSRYYYCGFRLSLKTDTPLPTVTIRGTVYDADSGEPIADANVAAGTFLVKTDSAGHYELTGLYAGDISIMVSKEGYGISLDILYSAEEGVTYNRDILLACNVNSGFMPSTDGFHFQNPNVFGVGFCKGFTYLSLLCYFLSFEPPLDNVWDTCFPWNQAIVYSHFTATAISTPGVLELLLTYPPMSGEWVEDNLAFIKSCLSLGTPCPLTLSPSEGVLFHSVLAYRVVENHFPDRTEYNIYVYDSSSIPPDGNSYFISVTHQNNIWTMSAYGNYEKFIADFLGTQIENIKKRVMTLTSNLVFLLGSPATLDILDPDGTIINRNWSDSNGIYYRILDFDGDGDEEELAIILWPQIGEYLVSVIPDPCAEPNATFTLEEYKFGRKTVLAEDVAITDIPSEPYLSVALIPAVVNVVPDNVYPNCTTQHLSSFIELPIAYTPNDIDANTVHLYTENHIGVLAEPNYHVISDHDSDGVPDLTVSFDSNQILESSGNLSDGQQLPLVIAGYLMDGTRFEGRDTIIIRLVDDVPPEFSLSVSPSILWPPNHKMVKIAPTWTVSDNCDELPTISLVNITTNEGDETNTYEPVYDDTTGDGHTIKDIQVSSDGTIYLRAERSGNGSGRVYVITYKAIDDSGNVTIRSATVTVPHNQP